ncbi:MAG: hypothetical protein ABI321_13740 [Polyangia bacterium]
MKLFGGAKPTAPTKQEGAKDEDAGYFDSPSETVSLSAPAQKSEPAPVVREEQSNPEFGINAAIQLMRSLPIDKNPELVVTVIKTTLESLRVKVSDIIADATKKQAQLEGRVEMLTKEISDFEREILQRKEEIARLEADHLETTSVKERLELAELGATSSDKPKSKTGS